MKKLALFALLMTLAYIPSGHSLEQAFRGGGRDAMSVPRYSNFQQRAIENREWENQYGYPNEGYGYPNQGYEYNQNYVNPNPNYYDPLSNAQTADPIYQDEEDVLYEENVERHQTEFPDG